MKYAIIAILAVLAALLFFICSPLRIKIEYKDKQLNYWLFVGVVKFKIPKRAGKSLLKRDIKKTDPEEQPQSIKEKISKWKKSFDDYTPLLDEMLLLVQNRVRLKQIYLRVRFGTGEASSTGMIYGAVWAFVGSIYAYLCRYIWVEFPQIELEPDFQGKAFDTEVSGIIEARAVHIITAVFRSLKIFLKHKKKKGAN